MWSVTRSSTVKKSYPALGPEITLLPSRGAIRPICVNARYGTHPKLTALQWLIEHDDAIRYTRLIARTNRGREAAQDPAA